MKKFSIAIHFPRLLAILFLAIGSLVPSGTANAQTLFPKPMDPDAVSAFFDTLIPRQLVEKHIAGAMVSVVANDKTILARGYGLANIEEQIQVDPGKTLFRIGSVPKLFTWTAVMQMVEQGKLDLDMDINQYLDFQIPATFPQPITLKHLMSHTSGFEEDNFEREVRPPAVPGPRKEYLVSHMPARVREPGKWIAYSNYGTAMAAYLVQRIAAPAIIFAAVWIWKRKIWGPVRRVHYTVATLAVAALTFSFWVWNLIGWQF